MGSIEDFFKKLRARSYQEMTTEPQDSWEHELNRFISKHPKVRRVIERV